MESIDRYNMLLVLENFYKQLEEASRIDTEMRFDRIKNILVCGMGGSAIAGEVLKAYVNELPVKIIRGYEVPSYISRETLAFALSHSGNTEETISCYKELVKRCIPTVAICTGGKLAELSKNSAQIILPENAKKIMPRQATLYMLMPMLNILHNSSLIKIEGVEATIEALKNPFLYQRAKELAEAIESTPLFYASYRNSFAAMTWKISFNENAKMAAFYNEILEMQHNELAWLANSNGQYTIVLIKDNQDHPRVKERFEILERLIADKVKCVIFDMVGVTRLERIITSIYMAHLVGYYKAISKGVDPTPIEVIEKLKAELTKNS